MHVVYALMTDPVMTAFTATEKGQNQGRNGLFVTTRTKPEVSSEMNPITFLLGIGMVGFGIYTAWARRARPEQFSKLAAMKKTWGDKTGELVHIIGYTVVPIVAGIIFVLRGLAGGSQ